MYIMKKSFARLEKGLSLIEVEVSMIVFIIIMTSAVGVFANLVKKHTEIKKIQQHTEELSLAMAYMTKKIRMSTITASGDCTVTSCKVHDHATDADVTFTFNATNHTLEEKTLAVGTTVIAEDVSGGFVASSGLIPIVTMYMMMPGHTETSVQSSVSLRSY